MSACWRATALLLFRRVSFVRSSPSCSARTCRELRRRSIVLVDEGEASVRLVTCRVGRVAGSPPTIRAECGLGDLAASSCAIASAKPDMNSFSSSSLKAPPRPACRVFDLCRFLATRCSPPKAGSGSVAMPPLDELARLGVEVEAPPSSALSGANMPCKFPAGFLSSFFFPNIRVRVAACRDLRGFDGIASGRRRLDFSSAPEASAAADSCFLKRSAGRDVRESNIWALSAFFLCLSFSSVSIMSCCSWCICIALIVWRFAAFFRRTDERFILAIDFSLTKEKSRNGSWSPSSSSPLNSDG
mmetsp:Transcript_25342/g.63567  ORF Transcript_25342/g.63567 Transcript_25342/m.63567 type:complete len:301 (+) Transcript_25342:663-1565(+)